MEEFLCCWVRGRGRGHRGRARERALSAPSAQTQPLEQLPGVWPGHGDPKVKVGTCIGWGHSYLFWTQNSFCREEGCDEGKGKDSRESGAEVGVGKPIHVCTCW